HLHLPPAELDIRAPADGKIQISTNVFARQVSLLIDNAAGALIEDNHFDIAPGRSRTITVSGAPSGSRVTVRAVNAEPTTVLLE
ncbi:MAG: hypothetical protein HQ592_10020, partial [Planctomycetes bacterium]|nr:hypothetical protein [Planctomycetota bacterium]